ncbi:hypothetical protein ANCCAN_12004 [Ancylostoma caninum]|uniref:Secreted protein n=1 Tax=Ancylostoma caninum TaxID=29170 RepID=A0A368GEE2_ANCCA|nr:hypothetical protein ANCCAN_12004 [Ancylostoma caninum]
MHRSGCSAFMVLLICLRAVSYCSSNAHVKQKDENGNVGSREDNSCSTGGTQRRKTESRFNDDLLMALVFTFPPWCPYIFFMRSCAFFHHRWCEFTSCNCFHFTEEFTHLKSITTPNNKDT